MKIAENRRRPLKAVAGWIDRYVGQLSGTLFGWLILPLIGVVCYEVFSRYVLNAPTNWAYDVTYMLYGTHFMLGAAYTLYKGAHVRTDVFYHRYSTRTRGIVDSLLYMFFFFPGMLFFMLVGGRACLTAWRIKETTSLTPWEGPLYLYKAVIPVSILLLLVQGLSEFIKSAYAGLTGEEL